VVVAVEHALLVNTESVSSESSPDLLQRELARGPGDPGLDASESGFLGLPVAVLLAAPRADSLVGNVGWVDLDLVVLAGDGVSFVQTAPPGAAGVGEEFVHVPAVVEAFVVGVLPDGGVFWLQHPVALDVFGRLVFAVEAHAGLLEASLLPEVLDGGVGRVLLRLDPGLLADAGVSEFVFLSVVLLFPVAPGLPAAVFGGDGAVVLHPGLALALDQVLFLGVWGQSSVPLAFLGPVEDQVGGVVLAHDGALAVGVAFPLALFIEDEFVAGAFPAADPEALLRRGDGSAAVEG